MQHTQPPWPPVILVHRASSTWCCTAHTMGSRVLVKQTLSTPFTPAPGCLCGPSPSEHPYTMSGLSSFSSVTGLFPLAQCPQVPAVVAFVRMLFLYQVSHPIMCMHLDRSFTPQWTRPPVCQLCDSRAVCGCAGVRLRACPPWFGEVPRSSCWLLCSFCGWFFEGTPTVFHEGSVIVGWSALCVADRSSGSAV